MGVVAILNNRNAVPVDGELGRMKMPVCDNLWSGGTGTCDDGSGGEMRTMMPRDWGRTGPAQPTSTTPTVIPVGKPAAAPADDGDLLFGVIKTSTALIVAAVAAGLYFLNQSGGATKAVKSVPAPATGGFPS